MYTLYCDGSSSWKKSDGGWAFILFKNYEFITSISDYEENTTNNREELRSCIEGLIRVPEGEIVFIYSDSKYLVNSYNNCWIESWIKNDWKSYRSGEPIKNQDLWIKLYKLSEERIVNFRWVAGHSGVKFNELCDERARYSRKNKVRKTYNE